MQTLVSGKQTWCGIIKGPNEAGKGEFWVRWECGVQDKGLGQEGGKRMSNKLVGNKIRRNPSTMNI